ncbi:endopeptidase La [Marinomonas mediterranea]|uniref:Lon protease n=1 Tax=Marinomonas mediterranea (strain ATCC 700492 / JCM 21426 / NBRC 103028 / MMB-1) TaxID=717774 RepID=F2K465_MARM1|nr:endopeptidase La [Marinomonas mediterranea]ADZ92506.1 anti-sigma H sporulation factor, LonB [Marinomonas mediterranea MMB-1]WCN14500.1 endopeptidase La [Marinomonas mediterranea]WCN18551.1 endopeptidase La [Marinomonas mediterranea MMB-1]
MSDDNVYEQPEGEIVDENSDEVVISDPKALALPDDVLPDTLFILPVSSRPFFPAQVQPVMVDAEPWEETLERIAEFPQAAVGLIYAEKTANGGAPNVANFKQIGCVARIHKAEKQDEKITFLAQGLKRIEIVEWLETEAPYLARVRYINDSTVADEEAKAYSIAILDAIKELIRLNPLFSEDLRQYLGRFSFNEPGLLADFAASITSAEPNELYEALSTLPVIERMKQSLLLLKKELEIAHLQNEISAEVNDKISKHQREFFLKEQLKVIQKELGLSKDDRTSDIDTFQERLDGKNVPDAAYEKIEDELHKLSILETGSPEYGVTRNYLDWATSLPWGVHSEDNLDISKAREVLNGHHSGLDDVKDRIIEFLALGAHRKEMGGSIMLLVGPPGVGKTSIGKSVAAALGRKFYRFSLGGMRDESEIKGHRRTYIGSLPGKFVQALKDVQVENPVIMLDEIDKIGSSFQGDPASALLEALDPEQNSEFLDHYLDMRINLSKTLFVCTANQLDTIPAPLLDRMDVIRLSGYIAEEKVAIAKQHLWPKLLKKNKLLKKQLNITDAALKHIIEYYAREAGVRGLDKLLQKVLRKSVVRLLTSETESINVGVKDLEDLLGMPYFRPEKTLKGVGVVTGLAWTSMGGATLPVEANKVHELTRGLKLTGKLGEVMKESAEIAYSYVLSHTKSYQSNPEFFDKCLIHLHVPEGATPKDGPSAGITMATALMSLAKGQAVNRPLAMTGELTLTGQVLAVGGIREKIIAAKRSKVNEIILPEANRRDFEELPDSVKEGISVHFAERFADVEKIVFGKLSNDVH